MYRASFLAGSFFLFLAFGISFMTAFILVLFFVVDL